MKTANRKFGSLVPIVVLALIVASCTSTKYAALPCPDLPQGPKTKEIKIPKNFKIFASRPAKKNSARTKRRNSKNNSNQISPINQVRAVNSYYVANVSLDESSTDNIIAISQINTQNLPPPSEEYYSNAIDNIESQPFVNETSYLNVKLLSPYIPKYRPSETKMLKSTSSYQDSTPQIEGLGIAGFIAGIVGLLIFGIPLGTIAIIFGGISLSKIKNNPQKYSGRGFAIASLTLGIISVAGVIFLLLLV